MANARTIKKTFSQETSVSIDIDAAPELIWDYLVNSAAFPDWNSTVTSIDGDISLGSTIRLKSTLDAKRVFKIKVKEFTPYSKLVWGDAMGTRIFQLSPSQQGATTFSMVEKIGGPIFPLFAGKLPSFVESFNSFARDLKTVAERG